MRHPAGAAHERLRSGQTHPISQTPYSYRKEGRVHQSMFRQLVKLPRQLWTYARLASVSWLDNGRVAACRYPRSQRQLQHLADAGITLIVNLHPREHAAERLQPFGIRQIHLPVPDFTPPSQAQLAQGVAAMREATASGERVAVHCGAGLGRTGTLVACYLVAVGFSPDEAIRQVRTARPGSIETPEQEAAVRTFASGASER